MCRGCDYLSNGQSTTDIYLSLFDQYQRILVQTKDLQKSLLAYSKILDEKEHQMRIDKFRREIMKGRKIIAKAQEKLSPGEEDVGAD